MSYVDEEASLEIAKLQLSKYRDCPACSEDALVVNEEYPELASAWYWACIHCGLTEMEYNEGALLNN